MDTSYAASWDYQSPVSLPSRNHTTDVFQIRFPSQPRRSPALDGIKQPARPPKFPLPPPCTYIYAMSLYCYFHSVFQVTRLLRVSLAGPFSATMKIVLSISIGCNFGFHCHPQRKSACPETLQQIRVCASQADVFTCDVLRHHRFPKPGLSPIPTTPTCSQRRYI